MNNLTYDNLGKKMGDDDGPAYAAYSKTGYNTASIDLSLGELRMNTVRKSDGKFVNAYLFLGVDVYDGSGGWVNCADAGLAYTGGSGEWHVFYNIYDVPPGSGQEKWYESAIRLDSARDYRLTLDTSREDGWACLTVYDLSVPGLPKADSVRFACRYAKRDGGNTAFLQNYALDFPDDTKKDRQGNPCGDWAEITLANTDENLYLRNIRVKNARIGGEPWTQAQASHRSLWPDKHIFAVDYPVVTVRAASFDTELLLDLDMNRP